MTDEIPYSTKFMRQNKTKGKMPTVSRGNPKPKVLVIAGPTASGKSELAIRLARRFDGEIISADSRQVYRGMDIGTGKVTKAEQRMAKHWLLDVASPKRQYTAAQWRRDAKRIVADIVSRGRTPIICGGTGFYIDGLLYGTGFPEVKPDARLRARLDKKTTEQLFEELKRKDRRRARHIDRHNRRRLIRALEIIHATGKRVPVVSKTENYEVMYLAVDMPMETLKLRIEKRLDARLRSGMVAEVQRLHADGVSFPRLENFGLEYRWIARYLQGKFKSENTSTKSQTISKFQSQKLQFQCMRDGLLRDIIAYSKRQMTWWRRNKGIRWIRTAEQAERLARQFLRK